MPQQVAKKISTLDYGVEFQQQLIAEIISNHVYGAQIIDIIEPEFFRNQYFSFIIKLIKEYYKKYELITNYIALEIEIEDMYKNVPETRKPLLDTLKGIQESKFNNLNVPDIALNFCKLQRVKNTVNDVQKKLNVAGFEDYGEIEEEIKKAITFKEGDESSDIFVGIEDVLAKNYRNPIATGIKGLDLIMNGGLGKKEVAVIIAPLGAGKTTLLSLISSNAYLANKNILHIFFEDNIKDVKRKYICHWSGIPLTEFDNNTDALLNVVKDHKDHPRGKVVFLKLQPETVNAAKLRKFIKRERNKLNGKLDMVIIDYADCIVGERVTDAKEWEGEGKTMRQIEGMADEFDVAIWTAVQGGRKSTTANLVEVDMMGGNIKKAQVAHFIMSVAKTLTQRDQKIATIAILKSRIGDDGKVFENCTFDNSRMLVDTSGMQSFDAFEQTQRQRNLERVRGVAVELRERQGEEQQEQQLNN